MSKCHPGISFPMSRVRLRFISLLILLAVAAPAVAQVFNFREDRVPMAEVDGLWRFHPGDNPGWASPSFDDSGWALLRTDASWSQQGHPKLDGFAWYRAKVVIPTGADNLVLYIPSVLTSYQVFADGRLLGGEGGMPPRTFPISQYHPRSVYSLPRAPRTAAHSVVIAIRVWHAPLWQDLLGGGIYDGVRIGTAALIGKDVAASENALALQLTSAAVLSFLELLAGLAALAFFWRRRCEKEYLWFFLAMILAAGTHMAVRTYLLGRMDVLVYSVLLAIGSQTFLYALIAFFYRFLQGRRGWLFGAAIGSVTANLLLSITFTLFVVTGIHLPQGSLAVWNAAQAVLNLPVAVWLLTLLFRRAQEGLPDARLLLAPVLLQEFATVGDTVTWFGHFVLGWPRSSYQWFSVLSRSPFPFSVDDVCELLFLVGMLAIFVLRFTRISRQEDEHQREMESARAVQQVLIPTEIPQTAEFAVASVYKPASEVGGDFFQVVALAGGGVLVAIGDVSGKGMPAAMTVSLLVGTFRTLAHYTKSPGEILTAMNRRMIGRQQGGFTTCLVLRADGDGTVVMANAGHPSPYLNGTEIPLENGLPLGLAEEESYRESQISLEPGARLTLVTDGVLEARNGAGDMFGFDRTRAISSEPADRIAQSAQEFGQEDDITVLTISRAVELREATA